MRALAILALLPVLVGCEAKPAPEPEQKQADPVVMKSELDRRELLSGAVAKGDYKVNFGEPFIGFESRGTRMAISQNYGGPDYRVIDVSRSVEGETTVYRAKEAAIPGGEPFVLTISRGGCVDDFSLERTGHTAWLGTQAEPLQVKGCAAPAR